MVDRGLRPGYGARFKARAENAGTIAALKVCTTPADLDRGKMLHADAIESGNHAHPHVAAALVGMYMRCGGFSDARRVFDAMPRHNVVCWNALIQGYRENGREDWALEAFARMEGEYSPNAQSFVAALKACAGLASREDVDRGKVLEKGMALHARAAGCGFDGNEFVANSLIDMYVKCGSMDDASRVFFRMPVRSVVSWTCMILGFAENGGEELALELLEIMLETRSCRPDELAFVAALKACARLSSREEATMVGNKLVKINSLERGRLVHSRARRSGCDFTIVLESALVDMYAKCGSMVDARRVFDGMKCHNVVSWNALILGYAENVEEELALELVSRMQTEESCQPDDRTFVAAVKACASLASKENGIQLCGFRKLVKLEALEKGMAVHAQILDSICEPDLFVMNALVDMYARCRSMEDSRRVFDQTLHHTTVSWNTLILGYADDGQGDVALEFFQFMLSAGGCQPDALTYVASLKASNSMTTIEEDKVLANGKPTNMRLLETKFAIHSQCKPHLDALLLANNLVDAYASSGSVFDARRLFDSMEFHTLASWNTLMHAYADSEQDEGVLELFSCLKQRGYRPDCRTFAALLKVCGSAATLSTARAVHGAIHRNGFGDDPVLLTTLVDMYGKCGTMTDAQHISDSARSCEAVTPALLAGYSRQGDLRRVLRLYHQMRDQGVKLTSSCFVSVLVACSHGGLVETSRKVFQEMQELGVAPGMEHYVCMVDVLGRANQLEEAVDKVSGMPFDANSVIWMTILGACCKWKNLEIGRLAFDKLVSIDSDNGAAYTLMSNLCKS